MGLGQGQPQREYATCQPGPSRFSGQAWLRRLAAAELVAGRRKFVELATPLPGWINEIRDGQLIEFGGREWRVIVTGGHAFAHAAFYDAEANILIAGDHILPGISPVIAVYEMMPHADPLADYLKSFSQFDDIPDDVLVLPSHGIPYRGIRQRIGQLRTHHARRSGETKRLLASPRTALDLSRAMFPRVEGANDIGFALGETLAHVNHLLYPAKSRSKGRQGSEACSRRQKPSEGREQVRPQPTQSVLANVNIGIDNCFSGRTPAIQILRRWNTGRARTKYA